jgi:hypothetical protein
LPLSSWIEFINSASLSFELSSAMCSDLISFTSLMCFSVFAVSVELSLSEMISVLKCVYNNYELFY